MATMPSSQEVLEALRGVRYPGYNRDIVSFGMVRGIDASPQRVTVRLAPGGAREEAVREIVARVRQVVSNMAGAAAVEVVLEQSEGGHRPASPLGRHPIAGVRDVVAVASGKGGVGKSTVAANLTLALSAIGKRVGLMDTDVYGPSIPLMLGVHGRPVASAQGRISPVEAHGIQVISIGLFIPERTPVIWRGPMVTKLVTEFVRNVEWKNLDVLVIDLPPGTGDVQLTLTQGVAISGGLVVTTPQQVALLDVERGIAMFQQMGAPVLGIVENMSYHICPGCGARADLFGRGGGAAMAERFGVPLLAEIPLVRAVAEAGDSGAPLAAAEPGHPLSQAFVSLAERVMARLGEVRPAAASAGAASGS